MQYALRAFCTHLGATITQARSVSRDIRKRDTPLSAASRLSAEEDLYDVNPLTPIEAIPARLNVIIRAPFLTDRLWFRAVSLLHHRGVLSGEDLMFARFVTYQRIDPDTGRIMGRDRYRDPTDLDTPDTPDIDRVDAAVEDEFTAVAGEVPSDGGMDLADRFACVYAVPRRRFWVLRARFIQLGLLEVVTRAAPGRKAVYALVLAPTAIPANLPQHLAAALHAAAELSALVDPALGVSVGHLSATHADQRWEHLPVRVPQGTAEALASAPRWEHPPCSPEAASAARIAMTVAAQGAGSGPRDLRCLSIAAEPLPQPAALVLCGLSAGEVHGVVNAETSPLLRERHSSSGLAGEGSLGGSAMSMGRSRTKRTPQEAATAFLGEDEAAQASAVLGRCWAIMRAKLGPTKVLWSPGSYEPDPRLPGVLVFREDPAAWGDLQRLVGITLRRTAIGAVLAQASAACNGPVREPVKAFAKRLWKIVSRLDSHAYRPVPAVPVAPQVAAEDAAVMAGRPIPVPPTSAAVSVPAPTLTSQEPQSPAPSSPVEGSPTMPTIGGPAAPSAAARAALTEGRRRAQLDTEEHDAAAAAARRAELYAKLGIPMPGTVTSAHEPQTTPPPTAPTTAADDSSARPAGSPEQHHRAAVLRARREKAARARAGADLAAGRTPEDT